MDAASGIRTLGDDTMYFRPRIVLKSTTCRVWSIVVGHILCEKKLWAHAMGTVGPLLANRFVAPAVAAVATAKITQEMVYQDQKKIEEFDAEDAHAIFVLLQML